METNAVRSSRDLFEGLVEKYLNPRLVFSASVAGHSDDPADTALVTSTKLELFDNGWYQFLSTFGREGEICVYYTDADNETDFEYIHVDELNEFLCGEFLRTYPKARKILDEATDVLDATFREHIFYTDGMRGAMEIVQHRIEDSYDVRPATTTNKLLAETLVDEMFNRIICGDELDDIDEDDAEDD